MKIIIDDQYNNDENKEYTIDKDGNVNLFINIGDEIEENDSINVNNNINSNNDKEETDNNFVGIDEEQDFGDALIIDNVSDNVGTIGKENQCEEDNYSDKYHSMYAEIENSLQEKYAKKEHINDEICDEKKVETFTDNVYDGIRIDAFTDNVYTERKSDSFDDNVYTERKTEAVTDNIYTERKADAFRKNMYNEVNDGIYNERDNSIYNERYDVKSVEEKGIIDVYSKLGSKEGIELRGARINLYLLNGVSPKLYDSKFTDGIGKVSFDNLPNGCYRIIAIVDRRYFEKPIYYNWNEVNIDRNNKHSSIVVVNKIKPGYYRR